MTDLEILESLPSLYPLKDFEGEAVLNICLYFGSIMWLYGIFERQMPIMIDFTSLLWYF